MNSAQTDIYRIIHIDNLPGILQRGGVLAPNMTPDNDIPYKVIHHQHIQERRCNRQVTCGPGGTIHDYVPFFFGPLPPMLYAIHKGNIQGYDEGQGPLIYLVSSAQAVEASGAAFVFTDGHAIMAPLTNFFTDLAHLDRLDWGVIRGKYWFDSPQYPDRCRKRQAEFLVHRFFPWPLIEEIGVFDAPMQVRAVSIIKRFPESERVLVHVQRNWYY